MPWCGRLWRKPICAAKTRLWPMKPPAGQGGWRPRIRRCSTLSPCTIRKPKISPWLRKRSGNTRPAKARILGPAPAPPTCRYAPATPSRPSCGPRRHSGAATRPRCITCSAKRTRRRIGRMMLSGSSAPRWSAILNWKPTPSDWARCSFAAAISRAPRPLWERRASASPIARKCSSPMGWPPMGNAAAIDAFLRVTAIDRAVEQPYGFLARILGQADDRLPQVVAAFAAWEKAEPGNYLAVRLHAKALSAASADATEIEEKLRRSIQLSDGYWESHFELGVLLGKKRDPKGCRFESYLGRQTYCSLKTRRFSRRDLAKSFCSQVRILPGPPVWELRKTRPTPPMALLMAHHAYDPGRCGDYRRFNPTSRRTSKPVGAVRDPRRGFGAPARRGLRRAGLRNLNPFRPASSRHRSRLSH